eukprot:749612-Hanusia_phi.AAC.1
MVDPGGSNWLLPLQAHREIENSRCIPTWKRCVSLIQALTEHDENELSTMVRSHHIWPRLLVSSPSSSSSCPPSSFASLCESFDIQRRDRSCKIRRDRRKDAKECKPAGGVEDEDEEDEEHEEEDTDCRMFLSSALISLAHRIIPSATSSRIAHRMGKHTRGGSEDPPQSEDRQN